MTVDIAGLTFLSTHVCTYVCLYNSWVIEDSRKDFIEKTGGDLG